MQTIEEAAFCHCVKLKELTLPETLREIGRDAFRNCAELVLSAPPAKAVTLGLGAFDGCRALSDPNGLVAVNGVLYDAFSVSEDLTIPSDIHTVGIRALAEQENLCSVVIPSTVQRIYPFAFASCPNLRKITLCEGIPQIDGLAFATCTALACIEIPESVKKISAMAFYGCRALSVRARKGSYAHRYAKSHKIPFEPKESG